MYGFTNDSSAMALSIVFLSPVFLYCANNSSRLCGFATVRVLFGCTPILAPTFSDTLSNLLLKAATASSLASVSPKPSSLAIYSTFIPFKYNSCALFDLFKSTIRNSVGTIKINEYVYNVKTAISKTSTEDDIFNVINNVAVNNNVTAT